MSAQTVSITHILCLCNSSICDSSVHNVVLPPHPSERELHILSYPLHPAGGIRGCNAQEGETGEGQRELPESQRGKNAQVQELVSWSLSLPSLHASATPQNNHLSINPRGRGCHVCHLCGALVFHQWGGFHCSE